MPPVWSREAGKRAAVSYFQRFRSRRTFYFEGESFPYFYHPYNLAWRNERSVEIPIVFSCLERRPGDRVLEVGNVLSHYFDVSHDIVDKYERATGVINEDAVEFTREEKYGTIISISTLEHIGLNEEPPRSAKGLEAIEKLKRLLMPGGLFLATVPVGINPVLDKKLLSSESPFEQVRALKRRNMSNDWKQVEPRSVARARYSNVGFRAGAILVLKTEKGQE